ALVTNSGEPSCAVADPVTSCKNNTQRTGPAFGAATLAIRPGMADPTVVAGTNSTNNSGCRVCHSVSVDGSTLITQQGANYSLSSRYALAMGNTETAVTGTNHNFPAVAPDGTWFLSSAGGMINGDSSSRAYASNGTVWTAQPTIPWTSFRAALPVFSPDGKHLSFNYQSSTMGGATTNDGKSLAVLDYDAANKVFSMFRVLDTPAMGADTWSSFLPSNAAVVFEHEISSAQFGYTWQGGAGGLIGVGLAGQT